MNRITLSLSRQRFFVRTKSVLNHAYRTHKNRKKKTNTTTNRNKPQQTLIQNNPRRIIRRSIQQLRSDKQNNSYHRKQQTNIRDSKRKNHASHYTKLNTALTLLPGSCTCSFITTVLPEALANAQATALTRGQPSISTLFGLLSGLYRLS